MQEKVKEIKQRYGSMVWDVILKVAVPLVFILGTVVIAHEMQIQVIEKTRFTAADGAQLRQEFVTHLAVTEETQRQTFEILREIKDLLKSYEQRLRAVEKEK